MSKKARINTSGINGDRLRKTQADYQKKFKPTKISLESITDLAIELGIGLVRKKLNIDP